MSEFDKIIGYEPIKKELLKICDMVHNREVYENLGAKIPHGFLIYGASGLGKTMMAQCLITEIGLNAYNIGHSDGTDKIIDTFKKAKENAPAIVFLDEVDKLADNQYVAIQSGFDTIQDADVVILATANDIGKLPDYLTCPGRFDQKIEVYKPSESDINELIKHYLKGKKISDDVNSEDIAKMASYSSCAEIERILNEAAISAAFSRHDCISMYDITNAVLKIHYNVSDNSTETSEEALRKIALHEAGHLVVCEVLCPDSIGVASLIPRGRETTGGFISRCKELDRRAYYILVSLAGKAAVELYYSETCASGCHSDIYQAIKDIRTAVSESGTCGLGMIDVATVRFPDISENMNSRTEAVVHAELERYMFKVRDILLKNRTFLEKAAELLLEKKILLYSDIKTLRESVDIVGVEV